MLPDSLDADTLELIILVSIAVMVLGTLFLIRMITRWVIRLGVLLLVALISIGLYVEREDLKDCKATCACELFGQEVSLPNSAVSACANR